jgi:hypothetical protein
VAGEIVAVISGWQLNWETFTMSNPLTNREHPMYPAFNYMIEEEYDEWARWHIQRALDDPRPSIPHDVVVADLREHMAKWRKHRKPRRWVIRRDAFAEGWFHRTAGASIEKNPHHRSRSSARWRWWRQGWLSATTHPSRVGWTDCN